MTAAILSFIGPPTNDLISDIRWANPQLRLTEFQKRSFNALLGSTATTRTLGPQASAMLVKFPILAPRSTTVSPSATRSLPPRKYVSRAYISRMPLTIAGPLISNEQLYLLSLIKNGPWPIASSADFRLPDFKMRRTFRKQHIIHLMAMRLPHMRLRPAKSPNSLLIAVMATSPKAGRRADII